MTLVKLDSGRYINTDKIIYLFPNEAVLSIHQYWFFGWRSRTCISTLTDADRDRIVEAMSGGPVTSMTIDANAIAREIALDSQNARRRGII